MHRTAESCHHHNLISTRVCRVEQCDHGTIHVTIGDLTLRMRETDLREIARALGSAVERIEPPAASRLMC